MAKGQTIDMMAEDSLPEYNGVLHCENLSLEDIPGEKWVPIAGFEGYYEVSDMGRVKSLSRTITTEKFKSDLKASIMTQIPSDKRGYLRIGLSKNGTTENKYVHILVGKHFIPNPLKKRTVNHKRGNKKDNRAISLEWHTYSEQHKHAFRVLGRKHYNSGKTGYAHKHAKEIECITTGKRYGSICVAAAELKLSFQNISKVCRGQRHHTGGLVFKFVADGER